MTKPNNVRSKLAIASWRAPREGIIYGQLSIDATAALAYIERQRAEHGLKVSITHMVGRAVAMGLRQAPGLNGRIAFGRFIPFDEVAVSYLVAVDDGRNLAKVKVSQADRVTVADHARQLADEADRLRRGEDEDFKKTNNTLRWMPTWLMRPVVWLTGWLASGLGLEVKAFGVEPFPFGTCCITSVGMFGIEVGYAPHTPFARIPLLVTICQIKDQVVAIDGEPAVRPILTLTATIDHRFVDGFGASRFAKTLREVLENPDRLDS